MKKFLISTVLAAGIAGSASAENIGVSMALFDDNFLTVLRNGMQDYANGMDGVTLQIEDAQNDVGKQLNQIQNFVASGVDAIIVNPVDTDATAAMSQAAADAGIPLVYVNRQPVNLDSLPEKQAFVASDEKESGTLEAKEVCRLLKEKGKDKGAKGKVLKAFPERNRVLVEGVNRIKKHTAQSANERGASSGGIVTQEAPIHVSNVMVVDSDGNPTRIGYRVDEESGKKVRVSKRNGKDI